MEEGRNETLGANTALPQSSERVDPEGSCKKGNYEAVFSIDEIEIIEANLLFDDCKYVAVWTPDYGSWEPARAKTGWLK